MNKSEYKMEERQIKKILMTSKQLGKFQKYSQTETRRKKYQEKNAAD